MGVSKSPQELAAKFDGLAHDIEKRQQTALNKAALASKVAFLAAPGAPHGKLNVGRGARTGVRYKVTGTTASVKWFGPVHLVDKPTKAHKIAPKKRGGKKAIAFNGVVVANVPKHPGTRGKHFFAIGKKAAEKESAIVFRREMRGAIAERFK